VALVRGLARRIMESEEVLLSVGLTRQFQPSPSGPFYHFLQVNNIHFREDPAWELG
jgi:hypothetical protein